MIETDAIPTFAIAVLAGVLMGSGYFGSLWWTVKRLPAAEHPAALYLASFTARMAVVTAGFLALLLGYGLPQLIVGLLSFTVLRSVVIRRMGHATAALDAPKG